MIPDTLRRALRRLESRAPLSEAGKAAFLALPFTYGTLDAATYVVREGDAPAHCVLLLKGFAYRHKVTGGGGRQILSVHMPGDILDLQNSFLGVADHNVQALTWVEVANIPIRALRTLVEEHPDVGRAMWIDTLIDAAKFREWIVNVGRRDSLTRIAHLLCEFALRIEDGPLAGAYRYELPMTQEQLADCTGLTPVHVNRVLKELARLGVIVREKRSVTIVDWERLRGIGDFSTRYLHLDKGTSGGIGSPALAA